MGWIIQTKQESRKSGGPQYYLHGLEPQTKTVLSKLGYCDVWLGTPYGVVTSGLVAVAADKVLRKGELRPGGVDHHRLQRQQAAYSVESEIKKWFCLDKNRELYKLYFRERIYHSVITGKNAFLFFPERIEFTGNRHKNLPLYSQPLTFTSNHRSPLLTSHLERLAQGDSECMVWCRKQIGRLLRDHIEKPVPFVGEEDLLRVSGALSKLGIQLDAYRKKGYDCFQSEFTLLGFPSYICPVEIKKRSSGFNYQILKKTSPERAAVLCLRHDPSFFPQDLVDVIELKALHNYLAR